MDSDDLTSALTRAADALRSADALLIGAGAGMGVDSGLPDFRGDEGFWKAYPPFQGRKFSQMSNPVWFRSDPAQAWGFFGHRLHLYRSKQPHAGFDVLRRWAEAMPHGYFVFTSNVDGHFHRAGFAEDRIIECHGSIHYLQCSRVCSSDIWPGHDVTVEIEMDTVRATSAPPSCPRCGGVARPNILMFNDVDCVADRVSQQSRRYHAWLRSVAGRNVVAIEFGAGTAIPTVRIECVVHGSTVVRVNPRDADVPPDGISLPLGALEAIVRLDDLLANDRR